MLAHRKDIPSRRLRLRGSLTALAHVTLLLSVATLVARALPLSNVIALVVAVGSPYLPLVALAGVVMFVLCRRILLSIVTVAVLAVTVAVQVPWYYFGPPADVGQHADIRVLSSNLHKGQADASSFVELAKANADVITVSELTPEEVRRFSQAGIEKVFPYSVLTPAADAGGIGLYSRFPVAAYPPAKHRHGGIAAARLRVPGVRFDPLVASVHVISPVASDANSFGNWRIGITATKTELDDFAEAAGPAAVIVAGDFNSTPDMRQFRDLLTKGYRDAVEQTGAGFAPTFPSRTWHPPLITIDHVLTRQAAATSIRTVYIRGSDHRALLATVEVPLDPTAS
jgi:endonuclease/exonuclease/phosphatase (EEP) superfamily protein YafD